MIWDIYLGTLERNYRRRETVLTPLYKLEKLHSDLECALGCSPMTTRKDECHCSALAFFKGL